LNSFQIPLPLNGTVLGGTMELHGTNISLACFHGINFKSKSWALFSLKQPCISFATEAQEVPSEGDNRPPQQQMDVHVVQTLTFSLGISPTDGGAAHHDSMATICRMSRNALFPPQYKALYEWFHYTFANSEIDGRYLYIAQIDFRFLVDYYRVFPPFVTTLGPNMTGRGR